MTKRVTIHLPVPMTVAQNVYWDKTIVEPFKANLPGKPLISAATGRVLGHVESVHTTSRETEAMHVTVTVEDWVADKLQPSPEVTVSARVIWEGPSKTHEVDGTIYPIAGSRCLAKGLLLPPQ